MAIASWIFGSGLLLFFILFIIFGPKKLPAYKHRLCAILSALLAGLFAVFLSGSVVFNGDSGSVSGGMKWSIQATGGICLFLLVYWSWYSPLALRTPPLSQGQAEKLAREFLPRLKASQVPAAPAATSENAAGEPVMQCLSDSVCGRSEKAQHDLIEAGSNSAGLLAAALRRADESERHGRAEAQGVVDSLVDGADLTNMTRFLESEARDSDGADVRRELAAVYYLVGRREDAQSILAGVASPRTGTAKS